MDRRVLRPALLVAFLTWPVNPVVAGNTAQSQLAMPTRLVQQFMALENSLVSFVAKRDFAALGMLLAPDFELRDSANPGQPTSRAEWINLSIARGPVLTGIEQMAVHEYGTIAVVSFLAKTESRSAQPGLFVIDVWSRSGHGWRLATRYAGPAGNSRDLVPGAGSGAQSIEKKY